jgi:hypothetical protein
VKARAAGLHATVLRRERLRLEAAIRARAMRSEAGPGRQASGERAGVVAASGAGALLAARERHS